MCGRYYIEEDHNEEQLLQIIIKARDRALMSGEEVKTGEIFPANVAPVIAMNRKREKSVFAMKWGFTATNKKGLIINARAETAAQKPMFRDSLLDRRCIIPASGYYEWQGKEKYGITTPSRTIFMAGIYRFEGQRVFFCVLTTSPDESIAPIHDRMPLILPEDMIDEWLNGTLRIEDAASANRPRFEITRRQRDSLPKQMALL